MKRNLGGSCLTRRRGLFASIVLVVSVGLLVSACMPSLALAQPLSQDPNLNLEGFSEASGLSAEPLTLIVARMIRAFFGLLGIAAVGYMVYGGFVWMTAGGDVAKVDAAKKIMINATIGIAIMLMSFAIVSFIIRALLGATTGSGYGSGTGALAPPPGFVGGAALGQSIEYVIPSPGEKEVFRNTGIIVQFKQNIVPETLLVDYNDDDAMAISGDINAENVLIYKTDIGVSSALTSDSVKGVLSQVQQEVGGKLITRSLFSMTLKDGGLLGSPTENTSYTVRIGPQVKRLNDAGVEVPLFASLDGYNWGFEVGTKVDLDPPYITSLYPSVNSEDNYRNVTVLVQFNKSIMPTTILAGNNLSVKNGESDVAGVWTLSNMARTAEFRTDVECGKSACGDTYYCFDADITVNMKAKPADIDVDAGAPKAITPFNGLVSLTGNSFDGNGDGEATGPSSAVDVDAFCSEEMEQCVADIPFEDGGDTVDEYNAAYNVCQDVHSDCSKNTPSFTQGDTKEWSFGVGSTIDIWSPYIEEVQPSLSSVSNVQTDAPLVARYNEILLPSSIGQARIDQPTGLDQWYFPFSDVMDENNQLITDADAVPAKSFIRLNHADYLNSDETTVYSYKPAFTQGILDAQKNCYVPGEGPTHPDIDDEESFGCSYVEGDTSEPYCCDGEKSNDPLACAQKFTGLQAE